MMPSIIITGMWAVTRIAETSKKSFSVNIRARAAIKIDDRAIKALFRFISVSFLHVNKGATASSYARTAYG